MNFYDMISNNRRVIDINADLKKIESKDFDRRVISNLLINLREYLPENSISRDFADFVAHAKGRNKGKTFHHVDRYVDNVVNHLDKKGDLVVQPVYEQKDIMNDFLSNIGALNVQYDKRKLLPRADDITYYLLQLCEDVPIAVSNERVFDSHTGTITSIDEDKAVLPFSFRLLAQPRVEIQCSLMESKKRLLGD